MEINKESLKWYILALGLLVVSLILKPLLTPSDEGQTEEYLVKMETNTQEEETEEIITFQESDDNLDYSYIINPSALSDAGIGAERIQDIPEEINRVLLERNIKGAKLEIKNVKSKGVQVTFSVIILEHDESLSVEYNKRLGTIVIK